MNKDYVPLLVTQIRDLSETTNDLLKDLEELFKNKSLLNTHFSGKDKDLLRVIKSSLVAISKKEKDIEKLEFCTNVPLKEKCINLLKKYGYKLEKDPYENALVYDKEENGVVITIYLETFEEDYEFEGQMGLEILTENDISVYYNLKTEELSDVLSKIESVIKNKKWTCYDIFKKLSARNNHIEEADDNYFNYDKKTHKYSLKKNI